MKQIYIILSLILFLTACKESEKNEIYNENNTTVIDGIVYDIYEKPICGLYRTYYSNGTIKMEVFSRYGKPHGEGKFYSEDGTLQYKGNFNRGVLNGTLYSYFADGQIKDEVNFKNGLKDGFQKIYNEDGNIIVEIKFEKGKCITGHKLLNEQKIELSADILNDLSDN